MSLKEKLVRFVMLGLCGASWGFSAGADSTLLVDNFKDKDRVNALGQAWISFTDQGSGGRSTLEETFDPGSGKQDFALHLKGVLRTGTANPYTGINSCFLKDCQVMDLSAFTGIRLFVKGSGGSLVLECMTENTRSVYNHFAYSIPLSKDWQRVEIPFKSLAQYWGPPAVWNSGAVFGVDFKNAESRWKCIT